MASQGPRRRRLEVEDIGDIAVVNFVDKKILDEQNIQMIGDDLFRLVDELGRRKVLLNFGNVEFMSSAALGKLITLHRKLQAVQGKLVLCKIAKDILDVFKITKLDKILSITPDEQSGLQSFSLPSGGAWPSACAPPEGTDPPASFSGRYTWASRRWPLNSPSPATWPRRGVSRN
jgi:anti-sigma B factor antagonist